MIKLLEFLEGQINLIRIEVDTDVTAYTIFETLNDRGLDLSVADLVKNHLLSLAKSDQEADHLFAKWETLLRTLDDETVTGFLRHDWMSKNGVVTERGLFKAFKEDIQKNKKDPLGVLTNLADEAEAYVRLIRPVVGDPCAWELMSLSEMRLRQALVFLLAAKAAAKSDKDFERAVWLAEAVTVRYTIAANKNPNQLERAYAEWATQLRREGFAALERLKDKARAMCPSDEEFSLAFETLQGLKPAVSRYLLRKLAQQRGTKETEISMNRVDLEHILPESPSPAWLASLQCSPEEATILSQRFGNLTLLDEKLNRQASNKPFQEKRDARYARSKISLTTELKDYPNWGPAEIEQRQKRFAQEALKAWAI